MEKRKRRRAAKRRVCNRLACDFSLLVLLCFSLSGCSEKSFSEETKMTENIEVDKIAGDSLATVFKIKVKDTVKTHRHHFHSETIYVIAGSANMYMNDSMFTIQKGDILFVPFKTWHSVKVTSPNPLEVLSVQSPGFDGTDREFLDEFKEKSDSITSVY